ncbi:MAG: acetylglutamate kinase [Elusimicrobiota bacterium]
MTHSKYLVVKTGGSVFADPSKRRALFRNILKLTGKYSVLLVHGGKKQIDSALMRAGVKSRFVGGQRYTNRDAVNIVAGALDGVRKSIVAELNMLGRKADVMAIGVSGAEKVSGRHLITAKRIFSLGYVGEIKSVRASLLSTLFSGGEFGARVGDKVVGRGGGKHGRVVVLSPVCADINAKGKASPVDGREHHILNVNADAVASAVAASLGARALVFISDVPGVLDNKGNLISKIKCSEIDNMKKKRIVGGGMIPKLDGCRTAIKKGVKEVHITNQVDFLRKGTRLTK